MRASVLQESNELAVREVEDPVPEGDEVLIRPIRSGLCPSGVAAVRRGSSWGFDRPVGFAGHEFSGEVVETGPDVRALESGDRVVGDLEINCGHCHFCRTDRENLCPNLTGLGYFSHAEYVKAVGDQTHEIPGDLDYEAAAFTEPVACVLHSVKTADVPDSGTAVIVGAGQMGLLHLKMLRAFTSTRVLMTDVRADRRERAARMGADEVLAPGDDLPSRVEELTGDDPVDSVFVTVGNTAVQETAFDLVGTGGTVALYAGIHGESSPQITHDPNRVHYDEVSVVGTSSKTKAEFARALDIVAKGSLGVTDLITDRIPLADVDSGVEAVARQETIKTMVKPQE
jgi:threonine dehydrogenase-like Zn-dependent dehydrogenase